MNPRKPLRIAILAHSTNPRGGVVHALELGDALTRLGHHVAVHAPDVSGHGFFRTTLCGTISVAAAPVSGDTSALVETRIEDYLRHFTDPAHRDFDVFHAQDGISGNALARLTDRGVIPGFIRTVHHIDQFTDRRLAWLQERSIRAAKRHLVVSAHWRAALAASYQLESEVVGNGVDLSRYHPFPNPRDTDLRRKLGLGDGPIFLSIGGVEERKNTIRILLAFAQARRLNPTAQLIIAGGVSLLDHGGYLREFTAALTATGLPETSVILAGAIDDRDMPSVYRVADTLVFPSLVEGFGLAVLEAMASRVPVVIAKIAPFTEYLGADEAIWCDPMNVASIADAMVMSLNDEIRAPVIGRGAAVAARHDWETAALAHLAPYRSLSECAHA